MKKLLTVLLLTVVYSISFSQAYRNEWINYSQTYYKFKVPTSGVYRISKAQLQSLGIGNEPAQNYQLWHNGVEVPLYITITTGPLASNGYLEFYGQTNDGTPDTDLYPDATYQPSTAKSLFEDQGTYFLSVNSFGDNARLVNTSNSLINPGTAAPYCLYQARRNFTDQLWPGFASVIQGEAVRSSTFDRGEGFQSGYFLNTNVTFSGMKVYTAGPAMSIKVRGAGATIGGRKVFYYLNGAMLDSTYNYSYETYDLNNSNLPVAGLTSDAVSLNFSTSSSSNDYAYIYLSDVSVNYPRQFDFSGMSQVSFSLPANVTGAYLEINNFDAGSATPVLYDLTAKKRYECQLTGSTVKVKLDPASSQHDFMLLSSATINTVASFTTRNFVDYTSADNQGNYLIISNSLLNSGSNNQVQAYANFRSSAAGGSYNTKVMDIAELTDQFAYGINISPMSIRNFLRFAKDNYSGVNVPKFALLIGHGLDYIAYRSVGANPNKDLLNLVPTWGQPGSDNLLSAANNSSPNVSIPIGRISVVNNTELQNYLTKVVEFEQAQTASSHMQATDDWRKQVIHLIGASDAATADLIIPMMESYRQIISNPSVGAQVGSYVKANNPNLTQSTAEVANRINNGVSLITYFGHSSSTSLDFNLNSPTDYSNSNGKYPVFIANGCNAGDFFSFDQSRLSGFNLTISEKFVLAQQRGSIAFLASTHFGVLNTLDYMTRFWYDAASNGSYGKSLGEIQKSTIQNVWNYYTGDYHTRLTLEETTINGDPAVKPFSQLLPDFSIEPQNITITPDFISSADDSLYIRIAPFNLGKALNLPVAIKVERKLPNGTVRLIKNITLATLRHTDTVRVSIPIIGNLEKGTNQLIVTIDPANTHAELSETNNVATKDFEISDDEIRPIFPYTFSVVNTPDFRLSASTVNPLQAARSYRVQMDTTEKFNSFSLYTYDTASSGGVVSFTPMGGLQNDRVYYWRVAPVVNGSAVNWRGASFTYNTTAATGWSQSHLYQQLKSNYQQMSLDSTTRQYGYQGRVNNLFITHSKYPESGTTQGHFSISVNGNLIIRSACLGHSVIFNVFDTISFKPWRNVTGLYGSAGYCGGDRQYNFEFDYRDPANRKKMMDFMDSIVPNGYYVVARMILDPDPSGGYNLSLGNTWRADTALYGSGKSLYHKLNAQGAILDSINVPSGRIWSLVYRKNSANRFPSRFDFSPTIYDRITASVDCPTIDTLGYVTSPKFGPARSWQAVHWRGHSLETGTSPDSTLLSVYGFDITGARYLLYSRTKDQPDFSISDIDAPSFPYLQLQLRNQDATNASPWQLDSWKIDYTPVPEGGIAPNMYYTATDSTAIDSVKLSKYGFGVAFKNVSKTSFDSLKVKITLIDSLGVNRQFVMPKLRPITSGDTVKVFFELGTDTLEGKYNMLVDINPDNDQAEQVHFNNFLYKTVVVLRSADLGICPGSSITYKAENAPVGTYRWQVDTGTGYINIVDDAIYSGSGTTSLRLNVPPTSWYGYKYRCMITSGATTYSKVYTLKFAVKWNGSTDTAWENVSNWSCGVLPDANTDVIVNSAINRYPVVNSAASCRSIKALPNSVIRVTAGNSLKVAGKSAQ